MAPIVKTYGRKSRFTLVEKDDTFDKLFRSKTSNVFDSSSDREPTENKSIGSHISQDATAKSKRLEDSSINSSILQSSWQDVSYIKIPDYSQEKRKRQKTQLSNRIRKKKKKVIHEKITLRFLKSSIGHAKLTTSTPKIVSEISQSILVKTDSKKYVRILSPILANMSTECSLKSSPTGVKMKNLTPKNILETSSDIFDTSSPMENLLGFPGCTIDNSANTTQEYFYGFPNFSENIHQDKFNLYQEAEKNQLLKDNQNKEEVLINESSKIINHGIDKTKFENSNVASMQCDKKTSLDLLVVNINKSKPNSTSEKCVKVRHSELLPTRNFDSEKLSKKSVSISTSLQNLNTSNLYEEDLMNLVKSSSFEQPKITQISENMLVPCKINVLQIAAECPELNVDSFNIEESAINSADERSNSMKSGQFDEEELITHTSDEECTSGLAKEIDLDLQKQLSKVDSDCVVDSFQFKELEICGNVQSEDVSVEEGDLYTESEIAKSSDSIEVSRTANLENVSSDISTSSDKEILKDDESGIVITNLNLNTNDKFDIKQTSNYNFTRSYSAKSKDCSFYSAENSASDDSERDCEYESDCDLSCESNKSSRRSSLESSKSLSRETLEQLRESVSSLRIQDEYEDAIYGKSRKSFTKRGSEWECPPSPRRSLFPLAPLFPLPENQEDPTDDSTQAEGSMCDSATASEEDSNQSGSVRTKNKFKEEFGKNEETGRSSGEDDNTKHSPVREASRLRRSRRLSRKSRESESKLNMVIEESDSESTEADVVQQIEHIVLPTGKKYRRSLAILKHLGDEDTYVSSAPKGRNYDLSVESVINMQSKTCTDIQDGRKSLMNKRMSLLSQCQITPSSSPAPRHFRRSSHTNVTHAFSPEVAKRLSVAGVILEESVEKSSRVLAGTILEETVEESSFLSLNSKLHEITIKEEDEEDNEAGDISIKGIDETKQEASFQETSLYEEVYPYLSDDTSRMIVMKVCQQTEPLPFDEILFGDWEEGSMKIGEGVFGEVFMIPRENVKNVIKIIPIEGDFPVNGEKQKKFSEICNELLITDSLSELREENENFMSPGFAELVTSLVTKGRYPKSLIDLWYKFDETKGSDNESPIIFGDEQLYLVLELGNAGRDLESYSFSTAKQGLSVFKQTVCALAVAEAYYEFEHRDMHWGNVLVSRTSERYIPFILNKERHTILTNGVKATIIDFTLSRMTFPSSTLPIYCDIGQDPDMFIGTGDYQFDIYRHMREDVQNNWHQFVPKTNVRWLHYLVDKMINRVKYQRKTAKVHKDSMKILKDIESWILNCDSSVEVALKIVQYR